MTMRSKDVVILCGGQGQRLRAVVPETQKVLAQVNGQPFLDILIGYLKKQGIQRIILCTGYKAGHVEEYYREQNQELIIEFSREEEPLGTGGALKNASHFINTDPFFVFNGDSFCSVDLMSLLDFHHSKLARASIVVSRVDEASSFGGITLDDSLKIVGFREKQKEDTPRYVNAGIYCLNEDVFSLMPEERKFSLEYDFFPDLVGRGFYGFCVKEEFLDIGTPERYRKAKEVLKGEQRLEDRHQ